MDVLTIAMPLFDENNEIEYVAMSVRDEVSDENARRLVEIIGVEDNPPSFP